MLRFYPSFTHEMNNLRAINGSHTGILKSLVAPVTKIHKEPFLKSVTGSMPHYHRFILGDPEKDMNYHLSGYGRFYQEALIKFNGESVERYAGVTSSSYASTNIVYASYDEMCKKGPTMPLEYINIFSPEQQKQMNQLMPRYSPVHLRSDQTIAWVKGHSLVYPGEDIWVPRQQFFVGYEHFEGDNDPVFVPSFSTGTAAHKTTKKAMINAITEYLQIDAFIMSWYLMRKSPKVVIDNPIVLKMLEDSGLDADSPYDVIPLLVTMPDIDIPVYTAILKRKDKKMPYMVVGTQGDLDAESGVLRGIMESTAIISMNTFMTIFDPEKFIFSINESAYTDLDTNVYYYGAPVHCEEKEEIIKKMSGEEILLSDIPSMRGESADTILNKLIHEVKRVSKYAVYLDITPPEVSGWGWSVMRVFIPEICGMCLPGYPFKNHPRVLQYGGIVNDYPHPLP